MPPLASVIPSVGVAPPVCLELQRLSGVGSVVVLRRQERRNHIHKSLEHNRNPVIRARLRDLYLPEFAKSGKILPISLMYMPIGAERMGLSIYKGMVVAYILNR